MDPIPESFAESPLLIVCPTNRDRRELDRIAPKTRCRPIYWEESAPWPEWFEAIAIGTAHGLPRGTLLSDVRTFNGWYDRLRESLDSLDTGGTIGAVGTTDDYPGCTLAAFIAEHRALNGPSLESVLICQHKYLSRIAQHRSIPEATPRFVYLEPGAVPPAKMEFPAFTKPGKSFFSIGAGIVRNGAELRDRLNMLADPSFFHFLDAFIGESYPHAPSSRGLLVEEIAHGMQVTLDGFMFDGEFTALGVVDSIMYPGTISFERFEYPSSLPKPVQHTLAGYTRTYLAEIGFDNGCFNAEFMIDPVVGTVRMLEVNPRPSSQFADLFEKVDGINSYEVLAAIARGVPPSIERRQGRYRFAASCVLRRFSDGIVTRHPTPNTLEELAALHPEIRVELSTPSGARLSSVLQDGQSFRFAVVNLGGRDRREVLERLNDVMSRMEIEISP